MPVTYELDPVGIIRTRCVGNVTLEEVLAHFDELERDPRRPAHLDVLLDMRDQTSVPEPQQLREVAARIGQATLQVKFGAIAVVVSQTVLFGTARAVETLAEQSFTASRVFWSLPDAETWLEATRSSQKK